MKSALFYCICSTSLTELRRSNFEFVILKLFELIYAKDRVSFTREFSNFDEDNKVELQFLIWSIYAPNCCLRFFTSTSGSSNKSCISTIIYYILLIIEKIELRGFLISWETKAFMVCRSYFSPFSLWKRTFAETSLSLKMK